MSSDEPVMKRDWQQPPTDTVHIGEPAARNAAASKNYEVSEVCCRYRPNADPLSLLRFDMGGKDGVATLKYADIRLVLMPDKSKIMIETHMHLIVIEGNQLGTLYNCLSEARVLTMSVVEAATETDVPDGQATIDSITISGGHALPDEDE